MASRTKGLVVVHAEKRHLSEITDLECRIFGRADQFPKSRLRYLLSSSNSAFFLAMKNGHPVGYGIALKNRLINGKIKGRIYSLGVLREFRKRGVGDLILDALEQWLVSAGASFITLETRATKAGAKEFFENRAYEVSRILPNYYASADAVRMKKIISSTPVRFHLKQHQ